MVIIIIITHILLLVNHVLQPTSIAGLYWKRICSYSPWSSYDGLYDSS